MPVLERWTPIRELDRIERRMRRLFEENGVFSAGAPASDIYMTDDEYVVELEVPGFDQEELEVEVTDHTLVVKGSRAEKTHRPGEMLLEERLDREFVRRYELPYVTDSEHVTADFDKGVLTLRVPKAETARPRKIAIGRH